MSDTKEKIVRSALKLFLEKGFYSVSISMIAQEVGISKPAIYHHFINKDALVEGVLDYFTTKMKVWNQHYFQNLTAGEEVLQRMFSAISIYNNVEQVLLEEPTDKYRYSFNELLITFSKYKPEFKERIARDIRGGTDKIQESLNSMDLSADIDISKLALLVHAVLEGCGLLSELRDDFDLDKLSRELYTLLLKFIKY